MLDLRVMVSALLLVPAGYSQPATLRPAFEVASLKPSVTNTPFRMAGGPGTSDPGRWTCSNFSLRTLLTYAYNTSDYKIIAPAWMQSAQFDIVAKVPPGATRAEFAL